MNRRTVSLHGGPIRCGPTLLHDDPMMKLDELKLMSQPAGRDVTESYLVA